MMREYYQGDKGENARKEKKAVSLTNLIANLKELKLEFYVNTKNEPVVFLPDSPFEKYWPAVHDRVASYICTVYYDLSEGGHIKPSDFTALLYLLKEECYKGGRRLTEIESPEAEKEPIIQALLCYLNRYDSFEGMTATLLNKLSEQEIARKITGFENFPVLTNIFSRRLNRLKPVLRGLGIEADIWHEEDGSHCKVKRMSDFRVESDAFTRQSSGIASVAIPIKGKDFHPTDGSDEKARFDDINDEMLCCDGKMCESNDVIPQNDLKPNSKIGGME
ncbi:MAG: hypothetical protein R3B84_16025 [Zavarzinella sp.]